MEFAQKKSVLPLSREEVTMSNERPMSDISYQAYLADERIMGSRCSSCGERFVPPRPLCPSCRSFDMVWEEMPQTGKLAAFTCITVPPPALAAQGYGRDNPYCSGVVELDGGMRVVAMIEGVQAEKPQTINVGLPLQAVFRHSSPDGGGQTELLFRPLE
jgi:hypothetical protein